MSYLHLPRLVFTGDFISDVSTVNNDPQHYNIPTFRPSFQEVRTQTAANGWWNPEGGATFDFKECFVKQVTYADGTIADTAELDGLIGVVVKGGSGRSAGKMVDLDPQQQGVSELWAVRLRILNSQEEILLEGDIVTTAFRDLQMRQHRLSTVNGQGLGASWTSVLENVVWSPMASEFRIFEELRERTEGNRLSVNLNGFGYYYNHKDGRFSMGKMIGAIGPWYEDEPITFTSERRLYGIKQWLDKRSNQNVTLFEASNFLFNENVNRLSIDLGNSFAISNPLGDIEFNSSILVGYSNNPLSVQPSLDNQILNEADITVIGPLNYHKKDWLMGTGGIVDIIDVPNDLKNKQLVLLVEKGNGEYVLLARESIGGLNVRADQMVVRLDAGQSKEVHFYGRQWGKKISNRNIGVQLVGPTPSESGPICTIPGTGYPEDGIQFTDSTISLVNGKGALKITGNAIHSPRVYIDGQIYFIGYGLLNEPQDTANNVGDLISVHLRDEYLVPDRPKWSDIKEIMEQFSNLYPIMSKYIVDLGDRDAVLQKKEILKFAFSQDINSPIYMPVTRDLSEGKRKTILKWLNSDGRFDIEENVLIPLADKYGNDTIIKEAKEPDGLYKELKKMMKMKMAQNGLELDIEPDKLFDHA